MASNTSPHSASFPCISLFKPSTTITATNTNFFANTIAVYTLKINTRHLFAMPIALVAPVSYIYVLHCAIPNHRAANLFQYIILYNSDKYRRFSKPHRLFHLIKPYRRKRIKSPFAQPRRSCGYRNRIGMCGFIGRAAYMVLMSETKEIIAAAFAIEQSPRK